MINIIKKFVATIFRSTYVEIIEKNILCTMYNTHIYINNACRDLS